MDIKSEVQVDSSASGRKDPRRKYACLPNEKDLNTVICIFYDKVTKGGISTNILLVDLEMLKIVQNV